MTTHTMRWGVLGVAKIATGTVIPAIQQSADNEVVAIASRSAEKAASAATRLGIARAHASYEELLADPEVDIVYNPLPNHLHAEWSIRALEAGKHVLCEKPLALGVAEAETMVAAAARTGGKLMEAFMYRFHPQWDLVRSLIAKGSIGTVRVVNSWFTYEKQPEDNVRNVPEWGGGVLMDIGCYCISAARFVFGAEPTEVAGIIRRDPEHGIDIATAGILRFPEGESVFFCGGDHAHDQRVHIIGTTGTITVDYPFNPDGRQTTLVRMTGADGENVITAPAANSYTIEAERFADAVRHDTPVPTPLDDALANLRVIEQVAAAAS
jgi:predicted dehydrogenase